MTIQVLRNQLAIVQTQLSAVRRKPMSKTIYPRSLNEHMAPSRVGELYDMVQKNPGATWVTSSGVIGMRPTDPKSLPEYAEVAILTDNVADITQQIADEEARIAAALNAARPEVRLEAPVDDAQVVAPPTGHEQPQVVTPPTGYEQPQVETAPGLTDAVYWQTFFNGLWMSDPTKLSILGGGAILLVGGLLMTMRR